MLNGQSTPKQAWPESVERLSDDSSFRTAFIDDLHELKAFLLQQIQELTSGELVWLQWCWDMETASFCAKTTQVPPEAGRVML